MKRILLVLLPIIAVLCGCGSKAFSGVVIAKAADPQYGWTDYLSVTYEKGEIVSAEYDAIDFEGLKKSESSAEYGMEYAPSEWIPLVSQSVVDAGNSEDMVSVSGATRSSRHCKMLLEAIEKAVKEGETDDIVYVEY